MPSGKICFIKFTYFQDSGGFQMVSLLKLAEITEEGVKFQSPHDGQEMLLTPEKSTEIQNSIGADIIMQLDDVVSSTTKGAVVLSSSFWEAGQKQWWELSVIHHCVAGLIPKFGIIPVPSFIFVFSSSRHFSC